MNKIISFLTVLFVLNSGILYYTHQLDMLNKDALIPIVLSQPIRAKHTVWEDTILPDAEKGRVYRKKNNTKGTLIELNNNQIVIDWDKWGIEIFEKSSDDVYHFIGKE